MNIDDVLKLCDHTNLSPTITQKDIDALIEDGEKYGVASICIPTSYVKYARGKTNMNITTVVGFPNGYSSTNVKVFEAKEVISDGATEIDMVINISKLKEGDYQYVLEEINKIKEVCGSHILKVIIETAYLSDFEKTTMANIVSKSYADYIKTSTGFASSGATLEDIILISKHIGNKKIKAAGGIKTLEQAILFIKNGCDRLGSSSLVKLKKEGK